MIVTRLYGGIGNQMFIYASSIGIADQLKSRICFDLCSGFVNDPYKRFYQLNQFDLTIDSASDKYSYNYKLGPLKQKFDRKINGLIPLSMKWYLSDLDLHNSLIENHAQKKYIYIDAYLQSPNYFSHITNKIRKDFRLCNTPKDIVNNHLSNKILNSTNSVCIHVRRNRALASDGTLVNKRYQDCKIIPKKYYQNSIDYICAQLEDPTFFLFGDDTDWFKNNLNFHNYPHVTIDHNKLQNSDLFDLWLMQKCSHFIISNSTFAWWSAFLSNSKNNIKISPILSFWDNDGILDNQNFKIID